MGYKLAFIGGGSVMWAPRLGTDLFLSPGLRGSTLCLTDIDPVGTAAVKAYLDKVNGMIGNGWEIEIVDEDAALDAADCVMISISTGGLQAMHNDCKIPEKYGIYHSVGDTVGPAGISRTLRNVPVFMAIARKMEKLCPRAWMVHVTNPLTQLTRAVAKGSSIRCVGLCHEYVTGMQMLKEMLKLASDEDIDATCVGVNHFTILKDLTCRGISDVAPYLTLGKYLEYERSKAAPTAGGTVDDQIERMQPRHYRYQLNFYLYEKLGFFPVAGGAHVSENFHFFNSDLETLRRFGVHRKEVLPQRQENKQLRTQEVIDMTRGLRPPESITTRSHEMLALAVEGLLAGIPHRIIAALPNIGQVYNLPRGAVVETWAMASRSGIQPVAGGDVPTAYHGFLQQVVAEQELAVEAALEGDWNKAVRALWASPLCGPKADAEEMLQEMMYANRFCSPDYNSKRLFPTHNRKRKNEARRTIHVD